MEEAVQQRLCKAGDIGPGPEGINLHAKVVRCAVSVSRESALGVERAADVLVGDETGCVLVTAVGGQVDLLRPGNSVALKNARVSVVGGYMRVSVDRWGLVEALEPGLTCEVNLDNNRSQVHYVQA